MDGGKDEQIKTKLRDTKQVRSRHEVWSWGAGTDGQLGTGKLEDENLPQLVTHFIPSHQIAMLACGGGHVIGLTTDGKAMSWGRGTSGELGHGSKSSILFPEAILSLGSHRIVQVSAGWNHSGFVSDKGQCFLCGNGSFGQLGLGDFKSLDTPVQIPYFDGSPVELMACGLRHSLVLLQGSPGNHVYAFGSGRHGQLGLGQENLKSVSLPCLIHVLDNTDTVSVAANGDHSAALCADGRVFTWGRGFGSSCDKVPKRLSSSLRFQKIALGWNHAMLLTEDGELFIMGSHRGVLNCVDQKVSAIQPSGDEGILIGVPSLNGVRVAQVAAGAEHSVIVTEEGEVKTWGWGEHGQLGLGDADDQMEPQRLPLPSLVNGEEASLLAFCGSGFSYAMRSIDL